MEPRDFSPSLGRERRGEEEAKNWDERRKQLLLFLCLSRRVRGEMGESVTGAALEYSGGKKLTVLLIEQIKRPKMQMHKKKRLVGTRKQKEYVRMKHRKGKICTLEKKRS